jgi:hypothetical protein
VAQDFTAERGRLNPLPRDRFDPGLELYPRVDRSGLITVRMARYSVPVAYINRRLRVSGSPRLDPGRRSTRADADAFRLSTEMRASAPAFRRDGVGPRVSALWGASVQ